MAIYTIADLHLSSAVAKPMDIFGSRWDGYAAKLRERWCATVTEADTVILPGDLSWGMTLKEALPDLHLLDGLPGRKLIGKGNHDYWWSTVRKMTDCFASEGITTISFLYNNAYAVEGHCICGARGWFQDPKLGPKDADAALIVPREVGRLERSLEMGKGLALSTPPIVFLHFPPIVGAQECAELVEVMRRYGVRDCYYGHLHGNYRLPATFERYGIRFHLIASDYLDFVPKRVVEYE